MQIAIRLPREAWATRRLYVATPMYGGNCSGRFVESILDLQSVCEQLGIVFKRNFVYNESLITRGRNLLAHHFLKSDCTHLLFIDSDIGFRASDAVTMLGMMSDTSSYDVLAGAYPTKTFNWDRIRRSAAKEGTDLSRMGNRFVVHFEDGVTTFAADKPVQVKHAGTGFMLIRRSILETVRRSDPTSSYYSDQESAPPSGDGAAQRIHMFFQAAVDPRSQTYLSEDYWFCERVTSGGGKVWICPWIELTHVGAYAFRGSLADHVG